ncbi:heme ABC exporter ATP-binding protein CcmA [Chitinibacter sp. S2-10]|uniref:heme ABC exporter ATP-binding protein CcmA n=1 Tax=Chitinibacter sp. S2-10 TaxID=3373597 RepID=UPI003977B90E
MLQIEGLTAMRGGRPLFNPVSLTLSAGQCLHLQGANGVGKTTLLKVIAGLSQAGLSEHTAPIRWQDRTPAGWGDDYGAQFHYLGHRDALKDTLSPLENLLLHARLQGVLLTESAALQALVKVGLAACVDLPVRQLSQGQKRRATLARFLALPRPIWVMDEPLVALDVSGQSELGNWIAAHLSLGGIALLTSHQLLPGEIPAPCILKLESARFTSV